MQKYPKIAVNFSNLAVTLRTREENEKPRGYFPYFDSFIPANSDWRRNENASWNHIAKTKILFLHNPRLLDGNYFIRNSTEIDLSTALWNGTHKETIQRVVQAYCTAKADFSEKGNKGFRRDFLMMLMGFDPDFERKARENLKISLGLPELNK